MVKRARERVCAPVGVVYCIALTKELHQLRSLLYAGFVNSVEAVVAASAY